MKRKKPKKEFTYTWAFEAFDRDPTFATKRMFGGLSAYLHGRMVMVLAESPGERSYRDKTYSFDIWNGIMFPTERAHHVSLQKEFKRLKTHPVLGKWLYLEAMDENFETLAGELAACIARGDERFGIYPKLKRSCSDR